MSLTANITTNKITANITDKSAIVSANITTNKIEASFKGKQGIEGLQGDKGDQGDTGPEGPAGGGLTDQTQVVYLSKVGSDSNSGLNLEDATETLGAAIIAAVALTPAETNQVSIKGVDAGTYSGDVSFPEWVHLDAPNATINGRVDVSNNCVLVAGRFQNDLTTTQCIRKSDTGGLSKVTADLMIVSSGVTGVRVDGGQLGLTLGAISVDSGEGLIAKNGSRITFNIQYALLANGADLISTKSEGGGANSFYGELLRVEDDGSGRLLDLNVDGDMVDIQAGSVAVSELYSLSDNSILNLYANTTTGTRTDATGSEANIMDLAGDSNLQGDLTIEGTLTNSAVTLNTDKVTNATHTGEVTGSGVLTVDSTAISNKTSITAASGMEVLVNDAGTLKKVNANDFLGGGISSVNTDTGPDVVLDTDDIDEGSNNLYYTEARVAANSAVALNTTKTSNVTTNLTSSQTATTATVISSDGTNAVIPQSIAGGNAGVMSGADKDKLDDIEALAEVNNISDTNATDLTDAGDSALHFHSTDRARANHTGTQTAATISDFDTEVANNTAVVLNTAKLTNVTTNLTTSQTSTTVDVISSDGTNATLPQAIAGGNAGVMSGADKTKSDGITNLGSGEIITTAERVTFNSMDLITGVLTGLIVSVNSGDAATFDISSGTGIIIDWSTGTRVVTEITFAGVTGVAITAGIGNSTFTNLYIDSSGDVQQIAGDSPTAGQRRQNIILDTPVHANLTIINQIAINSTMAFQAINAIMDYIMVVGALNVGNRIIANSTDLTIQKTAGTTSLPWFNWRTDDQNPAVKTNALQAPVSPFLRSYTNGVGGYTLVTGATAIDTSFFDNGSGTLAAVNSNRYYIKRCIWFPQTETFVLTYGQDAYNNLADAETSIFSESPDIDPQFAAGVFVTALIHKGNSTDLSDEADVSFVDIIAQSTTAGGASGAQDFQDTYDISTQPQILTDAIKFALQIQQGSGSDTDKILEGLNGAGSVTFSVDGAGNITTDGTVDGINIAVDVAANTAKISYTDATAVGLNTTHRTSDGSDHTFIDQAVTVLSNPEFATVSASTNLFFGKQNDGNVNTTQLGFSTYNSDGDEVQVCTVNNGSNRIVFGPYSDTKIQQIMFNAGGTSNEFSVDQTETVFNIEFNDRDYIVNKNTSGRVVDYVAGTDVLTLDSSDTIIDGKTTSSLVTSDPSAVTGADQVTNQMSLTEAEHTAATTDPATLYFITDAT